MPDQTPPAAASKPRKAVSPRNDRAILGAISSLDGKVDEIGERVARIEGQQTSQIAGATSREERISKLESAQIQENRVKALEAKAHEHESRIVKLERSETKTETLLDQIGKDLVELKNDLKPVKQFVDRGKLFLVAVSASGTIVGAVITALVLKALHLT